MSTPQTYEIQSDGVYRTSDGSKAFTYTAGTVIPMSLAMAMGLEGAGYDDPVYFNDGEQATLDAMLIDAYPFIETVPKVNASTAGVGGANTVYLTEVPRRLSELTITHVRIYPKVQSGNVDVGVFAFDGTTFTLLGSTGSTAVGAANAVQTIALTDPVTITPGQRIYLGICPDNSTATFQRPAGPDATLMASDHSAVVKGTSFPLATNAASFAASGLSGSTLLFWVRGIAS